jgi:hypothetical protein
LVLIDVLSSAVGRRKKRKEKKEKEKQPGAFFLGLEDRQVLLLGAIKG